ncbi:hypothetical protein [Fibrobacter sp. UWB13]|uniref:hypothetical protein n=1 Tax=Fibrobacter sp. UWB13 TaxID=1896204 RepID=UPI000A0C6F48|nr:hypothetical protein [Fibrobacter sp. UWB13]SMG22691.1 hypothetical protein SAMN05720489_1511 [Fibrobacter sp. UWB13]
MQRLLYPLIASALITIVPFLMTFEKGQNIVRGLFGYEYFALLLFIVFIKNKLKKNSHAFAGMVTAFALLIAALFAIAWLDLQNLLSIKNWGTSWYGTIPFVTCGLAIVMVWQIKPFKFNAICFILFVALILHLEANNQYAAQPLAQFPTIDYLERTAPRPVQRSEITNEFRNKFAVTDSVFITRNYVDTTRSNVIILVESWGAPLDIQRFEKQLEIFDGITTVIGIHNRMYSRTKTAEREDLIQVITHDSVTRKRDTILLPQVLNSIGYKTTFLFGGDSLKHQRYKYIKNIGFNEAVYGKDTNNSILNDIQIINKIDSILADTTQTHFIAWTTLDTKFPLSGFTNIYYSNPDAVDSAYTAQLTNTLLHIANLASKHPKTRFIVQGDHNPILSPIKFQERFYKRWVPFVILN